MNQKNLVRILCLVKEDGDYSSISSIIDRLPNLELELLQSQTLAELERNIINGSIDACLIDYQYFSANLAERIGPTPVIVLVEGIDSGKIALAKGAADYLEKDNLNSQDLDRSLRLCVARAIEIKIRIAHDLDRENARIALKESTETFRSIFNRAGVGIARVDSSDRFVLVNQKLCELTGYTHAQLTQLRVADITHPEDLEKEIRLKQEMFAGKIQSFARDKRYIRRDGSCIWVKVTVVLVSDSVSKAKYNIKVVEDINERKIAEVALKNSEKRLHAIADSLPVCIAYVDSQRRYQFVNKNYYSWFGSHPDRICGKKIVQVLGETAYQAISGYIDRVLQGEQVQYEANIPYQTGPRYVSGTFIPDFDNNCRVLGYYSLVIDISAQKLAAEKLRASEALYAGIFNHSADGIFSLDILPDGEFVFETINPSYEISIGMSAAEVARKKVSEVMPSETALILERLYRACITKGEPITYETILELPDRNKQIWRTILVPIRDRSGKITKLQGSARDITAEKEIAAKQLRFTRYQRLLASLTLKIRQSWQIDEILQIAVSEIRRNLNAQRVLCYRLEPETSCGKVVNEDVAAGFPVMLGQVIIDDCCYQKCLEKYREGYVHDCPDVLKAGFDPCYLELLEKYQIRANLIVPIVINPKSIDPSGSSDITPAEPRIWGLLCVQQCSESRDWSKEEIELLEQLADRLSIALYQAELIAKQNSQREELARSNAELQQFAYIASHDLQEPLRTIGSYAQLLKRRYQDRLDAKADKYIYYITDGAARMERQINDLLEYSQIGVNDPRVSSIDCHAIFKQAISNLQLSIRQYQAVIIAQNLPQIRANSTQILQLFQNLIANALKYRRLEPPIIVIKAKRQENSWLFTFKDNGIGIDAKYKKRIFQIFQRLHHRDEYPGTGIGLAICQKIVKHHGGKIWVESQLDLGSTFYFTLTEPRD